MKKIYKIAAIYMVIMAIRMFVCRHFYNIPYVDEQFINVLLPFVIVLTPFSAINYIKHNEKTIESGKSKYKLFMILFVPLLLISLFTIV